MPLAAVIPTPPRLTGNPQADVEALLEWVWQFYQSAVVGTGLLNPSTQSTPAAWNPTDLPSPSNTTIANAQQTANMGYEYADALNQALGAQKWQTSSLAYQFAMALNQHLGNPVTPPTQLPGEPVTPPTPSTAPNTST
jgi:hypothetical protein